MLIFSKDSLRTQVEASTGGKVTVIYDDKGYPSYMVRIPKFNIEDVVTGAGTGVHPAFIVGGVEKSEILIGQYLASVKDGRAVSLPGVDPAGSINFDTTLGYCSAKGAGWHMMTNAEWAAIALWCAKNGTEPNGNNYYGRDTALHHESGVRQDGVTPGTASGTARTLTGSGPASWRHDGAITGIADLNGNVWEWCSGVRLNDGEIQVIADNDAAADGADNAATSTEWKAIAAAGGALVAPGTAGSLKFDSVSAGTSGNVGAAQLDDVIDNSNDPGSGDDGYTYTDFAALAADTGITIPDLAKQLLLAPSGDGAFPDDKVYARNYGERLPYRGGSWGSGAYAGLGALTLSSSRSVVSSGVGFRPAFVI